MCINQKVLLKDIVNALTWKEIRDQNDREIDKEHKDNPIEYKEQIELVRIKQKKENKENL